jgi:hypothetical protein
MCNSSRARRSSLTNASSLVAWEMNTGPLLMWPLFTSPASHACWFVVCPGRERCRTINHTPTVSLLR